MPGRNLVRRIGSIAYSANEVRSLDLPRSYAYSEIFLRLVADITIITADATAFLEGAFKLIKRIEIVADGTMTIKSIEGTALAQLNHILSGVANSQSAVPESVAANVAMNSFLTVDFAMPRAVSPIDTLLNSFSFGTLELKITFGDESDMYSALSANVTINSASVEVHSRESLINKGGMINKVFTIEREVTATSAELQISLPYGNQFRGYLIRSEVDGDPVDTVINEVSIKNGTDVFRKMKFSTLQDMNKVDYELESAPTGYGFIDFSPDGYLTEALDTKGMTDLLMSFDVTKVAGTNKILIVPIELIPAAA
jgi:hypothetical protein